MIKLNTSCIHYGQLTGIQNKIINHLKTDKTINRLFHEKDDYYLQNLLCGKLEKMDYIKLMNGMNSKQI